MALSIDFHKKIQRIRDGSFIWRSESKRGSNVMDCLVYGFAVSGRRVLRGGAKMCEPNARSMSDGKAKKERPQWQRVRWREEAEEGSQ